MTKHTPAINRSRSVQFPDGERTTVNRFDYNLAYSANGVVQCDNSAWIKAKALKVIA